MNDPIPERDNDPVIPSMWVIAESFRRTVLYILAAGATAMGALLGLTAPENGPSFFLLGQLPGWPLVYGTLLFAFGGAQFLGVWRDWRALSVLGCSGATLWYVLFALSFVLTWFTWTMGMQDTQNPSVYPVAPYATLGALHIAAVTVLYHYWKAKREEIRTRPQRKVGSLSTDLRDQR